MNHKIAIIGPKDTILGFKAIGLTPLTANNPEEALLALQNAKADTFENAHGEKLSKYAIIFIIEDLAREITPEDYKKLSQEALPAIIPVPGPKGSTGFGMTKIRRIVEQAVGSDILGGK